MERRTFLKTCCILLAAPALPKLETKPAKPRHVRLSENMVDFADTAGLTEVQFVIRSEVPLTVHLEQSHTPQFEEFKQAVLRTNERVVHTEITRQFARLRYTSEEPSEGRVDAHIAHAGIIIDAMGVLDARQT